MVNTGKCQGKIRDGGPCSATRQPGKDWCIWHDPDLEEQRREWNRNAGKAKSNKRRARKRIFAAGLELSEVDAALCRALTEVLDGTIEPAVASAAATISRAIVTTRQAGELEHRLAHLEAAAGLAERNPA